MKILEELKALNIKHLQNDSRQVQLGDAFIAYPGEAADGRDYIQQAVEAGASAIIYEPGKKAIEAPVPLFTEAHLAQNLGKLAAGFYPISNLDITGITGTNGKTTIAYLLAQAYELLDRPAAYLGTLGSGRIQALQPALNTTPDALGVQRFLYDCKQKEMRHIAMEVSSHGLSLHRVDEVPFTEAIYSNLSHEHLDFHKTMDAYAQAKAKLFAYPSLQTIIINQDDAYAHVMLDAAHKQAKLFTYGLGYKADVKAEHVKLHMKGCDFKIQSPWGSFEVSSCLLGRFNVYNLLAVITSLLAKGYTRDEVRAVIPKLQSTPGRMQLAHKAPVVLVDYAHTPDALDNALASLHELKEARLFVVFGCGGDRDTTKRPEMGAVAEQYADKIILTSDNPRTENPTEIIQDIAKGIKQQDYLMIEDRKSAIQEALKLATPNDLILIAGKGHETYQEVNHVRSPFSDFDVVHTLVHSSK